MATVALTDEELGRVEAICSELDPESHELTAPLLAAVEDADDRAFALSWLRRLGRAELIAGLIVRAAADAVVEHGVATRLEADSEWMEDWNERYSLRGLPKLRSATWQLGFGRFDMDTMRALRIFSDFFYLMAAIEGAGDEAIDNTFMKIWTWVDIVHTRMFGMEDDLQALLDAE